MISVFIGFLGGLISAGAIRWWQYQREAWFQQIHCLCDAVDSVCEAGAEYWLTDYVKGGSQEEGFPISRQAGDEAKIIGIQIRIDGYWQLISERFSEYHYADINAKIGNFSSILTGGNFQVKGREASPETVRALHEAASELVIATKSASLHAITFKGWIVYSWEASRRRQDTAISGFNTRSGIS